MYFCGIDQSYTETGIVILNSDTSVIFEQKLKIKGSGIERLAGFYAYFRELAKQYDDCIFAVEGYSYMSGRNPEGKDFTRNTQAGELRTAIELALYHNDCFCMIYQPKSHRAKTIRYGHGDKDKIVELVNLYFDMNYESKDHNLADAFCIAAALRMDFQRLADSYGTELYNVVLSKTPFKNLNESRLKLFEGRYFG